MFRLFRFLLLSTLFLIVLALGITYKLSLVKADVEAIPEPIVPCLKEEFRDPEFNSGRPYQASPCRDTGAFAYMCSNNIKVQVDHVSMPWNATCNPNTLICDFNDKSLRTRHVVIDLSDVKLPILGNTQLTTNSRDVEDQLDDATKMSNYAAWYLNGANQKAEYGVDTPDELVNYSGPAKKLLPSVIQEYNRFAALQRGSVENPSELDVADVGNIYQDLDPNEVGIQTEETANHGQIVVCTTNNTSVSVFGWKIPIPWIGEEKPIPCYDGGGKPTNGQKYRFINWWEGKRVGLLEAAKVIPDWDGSQVWGYTIPPFPWQFTKNIYYTKAYNEWRGKECLIVAEKLLCGDIGIPGTRLQLHTNKWADLYQYIPLSNTTDKRGKEAYTNVHVSSGKAKIKRHQEESSIPGTLITAVPRLFFGHTLEVKEASENLNLTYLPKEGIDVGSIPADTEFNNCDLLEARTNPGDDLTFKNTSYMHQIDFTVYYKVDKIECTEKSVMVPNPLYDPTFPVPGVPATIPEITYNCDADIYAQLDLTTLAPYLEDIWKSTTSGAGSTFRKIFPKVGEGAPVSCMSDLPGVSGATYILNEKQSDDEVENLVAKNADGSQPTAIFFPHLGSVYDYFLKGIQTALRPQGYAEPLPNALCTGPAVCGEWESNLKGSGGPCGICNAPIGTLAKKILTAAGTAYNVPAANIWAAMMHEGADWDEFRNQFTDENVRKWSNSIACGGEPMPGCDPNDKTSDKAYAPFGHLPYWFYNGEGSGALWNAVQVFDPSRDSINKVSHCNFLDAAFASAKHLQFFSAYARTPPVCYGHNMASSFRPASCSTEAWKPHKIVQSQVGYWIGTTPWCPDGTGGPAPPDLGNNIPLPDYASDVLANFNSASCQ